MQQLDTDLWISDSPLRFLGLEVGARMTVVRLPGGKLLLHSPIRGAAELAGEVAALGEVAYLVAPNKLHHLFIQEWQQAFPDAETYVAPGLESKRSDLEVTGVLGDQPEPGWAGALDQVLFEGFPFANEVVFFHPATRTLLGTDLAFNMGPTSPPLTRGLFKLMRTYGRLSPSILEKLLVRDRRAFGRCLQRVLDWPFERVIVSHGEISETGGREELVRGYDWVLEAARAD